MGIGAKRVDYHCSREKAYFVYCFPSQVLSKRRRERGPSVDLSCTKGALILSREPNQSTEKHVQKETSLSSMAIEPPQWTPQIKPWRESKARMWEMCLEVCAAESAGIRGRRGGGRHKNLSSAICLLLPQPWRGRNPGLRTSLLPCVVTPPITEECPFTQGHLHYPWARVNGAVFNSKLVTW